MTSGHGGGLGHTKGKRHQGALLGKSGESQGKEAFSWILQEGDVNRGPEGRCDTSVVRVVGVSWQRSKWKEWGTIFPEWLL
jgi:hypothetical protein